VQSYKSEIDNFLKKIKNAKKTNTINLFQIDDDTLAILELDSIKILTETQKEMIDQLIEEPRTGAQLARLTGKKPQFISRIMKKLVKYQIVDHINAPFGPSKFYILTADVYNSNEIEELKEKKIPNILQSQMEDRGVLGNLMSLSFKEILEMIKGLNENEKQKVLDFIIEYCQVEEEQ
jgi:hypothetical protein